MGKLTCSLSLTKRIVRKDWPRKGLKCVSRVGPVIAIKMSFYEALHAAVLKWEEEETMQLLPALPQTSTIPSIDYQDDLFTTTKRLKKPAKTYARTPKWSESEDQLLVEIVQRYQPDWRKIGKYFPGKPKSAVKRRWENRFNPDRKKTPWTEEEDETIKALVAQKGMIWKEIAKFLPGRPPDIVKNRYYGHIKRMQDIRDRKNREAAGDSGALGLPDTDWESLIVQPMKGFLYTQEARQTELDQLELQFEQTCFSRGDFSDS